MSEPWAPDVIMSPQMTYPCNNELCREGLVLVSHKPHSIDLPCQSFSSYNICTTCHGNGFILIRYPNLIWHGIQYTESLQQGERLCVNVPKLGEIPPEINLADGQSVVLFFNPVMADIGVVHGQMGTQYVFPCKDENGKTVILKGGKRLFNAMAGSIPSNENRDIRVRITSKGAPRTLSRDWTVELVGA